ncbi:hypothetical protein RF11_07666 [Thelohanellus kitauei]|uniref:Uncharacterized protein n=1 Tax=Thelohanellus kitauei TaxID=669202 RepID=A0A0C2MJL6_THEKT|nr:hypothetical protein RF11_07666 [Thelohanellus kitauei]
MRVIRCLIPDTRQRDQVKRYQNAKMCCSTIQNLDSTRTIKVDMHCSEMVPSMWGCFEFYMFPGQVVRKPQAVSSKPVSTCSQTTSNVRVQETSGMPDEGLSDEPPSVFKRRKAMRRKARTVDLGTI